MVIKIFALKNFKINIHQNFSRAFNILHYNTLCLQEDNKEHSFEVSLFAELFNEMLMRDFAFRIYRALMESPDKLKEEVSVTNFACKSSQVLICYA